MPSLPQPLRHIVISIALLIPVAVSAIAAGESYPAPTFYDVSPGAWYAGYVREAASAGIVSGYRDHFGNLTGMFGPQNPVTVGEALKIALEGAGYDTSRGIGYGHWAAKYMSLGIGLGFQLTQVPGLYLDRPATRAEVSSLIADAFLLHLEPPVPYPYLDVTAETPFAASIQSLSAAGIVTGDTDEQGKATGIFRPGDRVNRAEMVKIIIGARTAYGTPGRNVPIPSSSVSSSRSSSSRSSGACTLQECGPAPGMPNWQCANGFIAGPSCERLSDGRCGWLIRQCPVSSSSSSRSSSSKSSSSSKPQAKTFIINYTDSGFEPSFITLHVGDIVKFRNQSSVGMWVASNPHPSHTIYPEFDSRASVAKGGEFSFTFTKVGVWAYHDHLLPSKQAAISVDAY